MNALIILVSIVFVAYLTFKTIKVKKAKYVLAPISSLLYGCILFYIGMSINSILYYILALAPLVTVIYLLIKQKNS